jgi:hypothetical protein
MRQTFYFISFFATKQGRIDVVLNADDRRVREEFGMKRPLRDDDMSLMTKNGG